MGSIDNVIELGCSWFTHPYFKDADLDPISFIPHTSLICVVQEQLKGMSAEHAQLIAQLSQREAQVRGYGLVANLHLYESGQGQR